jgi:hypothetical protein
MQMDGHPAFIRLIIHLKQDRILVWRQTRRDRCPDTNYVTAFAARASQNSPQQVRGRGWPLRRKYGTWIV